MIRHHTFSRHAARRGLTLIEAMLLLVIVSIVAVAAGIGLQSVAKVPAKTDDIMAVNSVLVSVMEQTRANITKNWPSGNFNGSSYAFVAGSTTYTPASSTIGTTASVGTTYATPLTGTSPAPLTINGKTYQLTLAMNRADPQGGTSYQTDYLQVSVQICPVLSGSANTNSPQLLVTYVTQP